MRLRTSRDELSMSPRMPKSGRVNTTRADTISRARPAPVGAATHCSSWWNAPPHGTCRRATPGVRLPSLAACLRCTTLHSASHCRAFALGSP